MSCSRIFRDSGGGTARGRLEYVEVGEYFSGCEPYRQVEGVSSPHLSRLAVHASKSGQVRHRDYAAHRLADVADAESEKPVALGDARA